MSDTDPHTRTQDALDVLQEHLTEWREEWARNNPPLVPADYRSVAAILRRMADQIAAAGSETGIEPDHDHQI